MDKEIKICLKCGAGYPATPEYFQRHAASKDNLSPWCKECKRLGMKHLRKTKDCKGAYQRWRELHLDLHQECFYAILWYVSRQYKQMVSSITDPSHYDYKFHKNVPCLFESLDQFADYVINVLKVDPEKLKNQKMCRIKLNKPFSKGNIQFVSPTAFYSINEATSWEMPPLKKCSKCKQRFYATKEFFPPSTQKTDGLKIYCWSCTRKLNSKRGQAEEHKQRQKKNRYSVNGYLDKLFELYRPINPMFPFRNADRLILLKLSRSEFIAECLKILQGDEPQELILDLIDPAKDIEKGNLVFLTQDDWSKKHIKGGCCNGKN